MIKDAMRVNRELRSLMKRFRKEGFTGRFVCIAHDEAHAASAYYTSGYRDCLVPVYEGYAYSNASSIWEGKEGKLQKLHDVPWPHSPGSFYRCVTKILGFSPRKHAGKITGLAAFGDPQKALDRVAPLLRQVQGSLQVSPLVYSLQYEYDGSNRVPSYFAAYSREDISAAFQYVLEEALISLTAAWLKKTGHTKVALGGGVVGNVKLNQRIANLPAVDDLYVQPAMSDCGQPIGAALAAYAHINGQFVSKQLQHVYLGTDILPADADAAVRKAGVAGVRYSDLPERVARLVAEGKVIAIARGRMEYGPRALGNRTILSAATDPSINDWLNKRLKRTEFMPFAPVTLDEHATACYPKDERDVARHAAEFMTVCFDCSDMMKEKMPAVVHVDGTARPQLIRREINPFYYDVLAAYHRLTGLPSLINTSFNMHEEPIVCTAADAIRAWQLGDLDALVLGDMLLEKKPSVQLE